MSSSAIVDEPTHHQRTHDEGPARSDSGRGGERPSGGRCSRAGRAGRLAGGDGWSSAASSSQMYELVGDSRRTHTSPTNPRRGASAQRLRARRRAAQRRPVQPSWEGGAAELGGRGSRAGRAGQPSWAGGAAELGERGRLAGGDGWSSAASSSQMWEFVSHRRRTHTSPTNPRRGGQRAAPHQGAAASGPAEAGQPSGRAGAAGAQRRVRRRCVGSSAIVDEPTDHQRTHEEGWDAAARLGAATRVSAGERWRAGSGNLACGQLVVVSGNLAGWAPLAVTGNLAGGQLVGGGGGRTAAAGRAAAGGWR